MGAATSSIRSKRLKRAAPENETSSARALRFGAALLADNESRPMSIMLGFLTGPYTPMGPTQAPGYERRMPGAPPVSQVFRAASAADAVDSIKSEMQCFYIAVQNNSVRVPAFRNARQNRAGGLKQEMELFHRPWVERMRKPDVTRGIGREIFGLKRHKSAVPHSCGGHGTYAPERLSVALRKAREKHDTPEMSRVNDSLRRCCLNYHWQQVHGHNWSPSSWRPAGGQIDQWSDVSKLPIFDMDGNYHIRRDDEGSAVLENVHGTLHGGEGTKRDPAGTGTSSERGACARVVDAEVAGVRSLSDAPAEVVELFSNLPACAGKRLLEHALSLEGGSWHNMSVCVCLLALQMAKAFAVDKFGADAVRQAFEWLEEQCGVAENHVGDVYAPTEAMSYYIFNNEHADRSAFHLDEAEEEPLPMVKGTFVEKGAIIYKGGRSYKAVGALYSQLHELVYIDPPEGTEGPGFVGVSSEVEEARGAFADGVPFVTIWFHTTILEVVRNAWFPDRRRAKRTCMVVFRHVVAGNGGTILMVATDGAKVAVVSTHLTSDLLPFEANAYPDYLMDPQFFKRVLDGSAWSSTFHDVKRNGPRGLRQYTTQWFVDPHQRFLALALVASGALNAQQIQAAGWPSMPPNSPIDADYMRGRSFCTLVLNDYHNYHQETKSAACASSTPAAWRAAVADLKTSLA